ncbi:SPOR domain-containing protein [Rhizobium grahamii]|uniref:SPOR domain-containing protein n=1 Tax=Rhizobium grahamii TaxID=1120045 RepID=A0A5Q0C7P7_9HYPH|nr:MULTISPECIES: SPOR domain-containing protein [Rhizobium]QFY59941.1 SPOR domain-containing protein [Rhizobium grahamii]QRM50941.1 SPOR domain-containing protein [Rhizobium sp. BG6]
MADKQRAYDARKNTDLFADDDPLAELARIVGFEPRVAANTVPDVPRQEPAFNLEDELLREFERYDAPHAPEVVEQPIAAFEESVAVIDEPAYEEPSVLQWDAQQDVEFPVEAQPVHPLLSSTDWAVPRAAEPVSSGARDLIEELEMSIGAAPASASAQPQKAPQWSAASIRLPLANFHTTRRDQPVAPVVAPTPEPVAAEPVAEFPISAFPVAAAGFPAEIDRHEQVEFQPEEQVVAAIEPIDVDHSAFDLAAAAKEGEVHADAALTEAAPAEFDDITFDIDDLLADVSSYPVPERQAAAPAAEPSPVHIPQPAAVAAMPVRAPELKPAARTAAEVEDPFAGHDFELDLEGIELELADLDFVEPTVAREVEAPRPAAPAAVAQRPAPAPIAFAPVQQAPAPVYREPVVARAPVEPAVAPVAAPIVAYGADAADELPFDLSMISDADYHPETVEEMHVPALPPVEQHQPVVTTSDFDFDVDSEIANLLTPAKAVETVAKPVAEDWRTRAPIAAPAAAVAAPKQPLQQQTFDEFERALEEDFRRSVNEPVQQRRENISEVQIQSASDAEDMSRARSMKRMLAAAAVIVVFGGAAYAGYSFLARDGGLGIVSGEPRVITADKDPVKVVPENPGGKTVPNQDKAVYDSVGGAAAEAPKQKALVSSDEQPVDVVQRTLTPETMPEDNDSDTPLPSMATPVGDTQDPRLLPNHDATETAADDDAGQSGQNPAVSARKVRTMIVKPDGTLVAREEAAPEQAALPKPTSVQTQKITPGTAPAALAPASGQVATADIRSTPVENAKPSQAQASENVLAKAAAATPESVEPPVRAVTSTKSDTAPVPAGRPATQAPAKPEAPVAEAPTAPKEVAAVPPAAPQPTAAVAGGYGVQIASLPSEAEAKKTFASLSKKFPGVLSGRNYEVRKAEIAGKGTFYRLRIPAGSKDEAAAICEKYRAAGGSCLISK